MLDFGDTVSGFFLRGPNGRLISLTGFLLARDFSKVAPRMADADFSVLDPLIAGTKPSPVVLVLHPDERAQSYFVIESTLAGTRRKMKIFQDTEEIVLDSLENNQLPVVEIEELKKAVLISRKNHTPVSLRIRHLELQANLPQSWRDTIRRIFEVNLFPPSQKAASLHQYLGALRDDVRKTMFKRYLSQCIWIDGRSGLLGSVAPARAGDAEATFTFTPFTGSDAQVFGFVEFLAKDEQGHYVAMEDQANVYPVPLAGKEWNSPTVHFYDPEFRERIQAEEFCSLYRGMEKLCELGAPVLVYEPDQTNSAIRLRVLKPSGTGDDFMSLSVSSFASQSLVWEK